MRIILILRWDKKVGLILKKDTLFIITWVYTLFVIIGFSIYAFNEMDSDWNFDFKGREGELTIIIIVRIIGLILHSIDGAGLKDKGKKVSKNTIYAGLSIGAFFLVWRLLVGTF